MARWTSRCKSWMWVRLSIVGAAPWHSMSTKSSRSESRCTSTMLVIQLDHFQFMLNVFHVVFEVTLQYLVGRTKAHKLISIHTSQLSLNTENLNIICITNYNKPSMLWSGIVVVDIVNNLNSSFNRPLMCSVKPSIDYQPLFFSWLEYDNLWVKISQS